MHLTFLLFIRIKGSVLISIAPTTESVIVNTYPPPDSGSSADSSIDHTEAAILAMQAQQRRESDWTADSSSRRGSEAPVASGSTRANQAKEETPLCAFVVDDDK